MSLKQSPNKPPRVASPQTLAGSLSPRRDAASALSPTLASASPSHSPSRAPPPPRPPSPSPSSVAVPVPVRERRRSILPILVAPPPPPARRTPPVAAGPPPPGQDPHRAAILCRLRHPSHVGFCAAAKKTVGIWQVSEGGNYNCIHTLKDHTAEDIPPSAMANIRTVSSLAEVNGVLEEMGIDTIGGANQVQFRLHEQASLKDATKMKTRVRPGRHGFKLVNSELFDCKFKAMVELQEGYNTMVETCMVDCDHQLLPLEARIAELKYLLLSTDEEIPKIGFGAAERNRGVQQMRYPNRLFTDAQRVPYQAACPTNAERDTAVSLDKRAQMAFWKFNLRLLEVKESILEKTKTELERSLRVEFNKAIEEQSDLGVGYATYEFHNA